MKFLPLVFFVFSVTFFSKNLETSKKNNNNKITICHVPPGNPGNMHEITISVDALQAHLDHGDFICNGGS